MDALPQNICFQKVMKVSGTCFQRVITNQSKDDIRYHAFLAHKTKVTKSTLNIRFQVAKIILKVRMYHPDDVKIETWRLRLS